MIRNLFLPFLLVLSSLACSNEKEKALNTSPNVLLIVADDLGWMDLSCYGSAFYETPNLDKLASKSMLFTDAYATCPVCSPTRASIVTGKYPARLQLTDWIPGRQSSGLSEVGNAKLSPEFQNQLSLEEFTLAELLKNEGYKTFFAGKWHLGQESLYWPENQGFDINKGGHSKGSPPGGYFAPWTNPRLANGSEGEHLPERLARETANFISTHADTSFFAYLSFYSVHTPLQGLDSLVTKYEEKARALGLTDSDRFIRNADWMRTAPERGRWLERVAQDHAVYAAMVESMDDAIGVVLEELERSGVSRETVVIFTSDNGGLATSEGSPTSNLPLRAGKGWLYEGGIREPMIVRWPELSIAPRVSEVPINSADIFPTIADILDVEAGADIDGVSILPLLKGEELHEDRALFWHYPHYANQGGKPGAVIRKGDYKLILRFEDDSIELYNLEDDLGEQNNLAEELSDRAIDLESELRQWMQTLNAQSMTDNPVYDPNYTRPKKES